MTSIPVSVDRRSVHSNFSLVIKDMPTQPIYGTPAGSSGSSNVISTIKTMNDIMLQLTTLKKKSVAKTRMSDLKAVVNLK